VDPAAHAVIGAQDRRLKILARLSGPEGEVGTERLCGVCAEVAEVDGAGIMLMSGDLPGGSVATTDALAATIEDLQYTLGEGPCVDAHRQGRPVLEPDLADARSPRWPAFTSGAVTAGVRAVFGFPLRVGGVRLGALNLYRSRPGGLSDDAHADALVAADIVTDALLAMQARAPEGLLSADMEANADFRFEVAQASGMVAIQLDSTVRQAMLRLRAYAFANGQPLNEVAGAVVERRLHFDDEPIGTS
jgi:GAF domain-containing protein